MQPCYWCAHSTQTVYDEVSEADSMAIVKSNSTSLKLNNNMLANWTDFSSTTHQLFVDPALTLAWIDLSFNDLRTIDEVGSQGLRGQVSETPCLPPCYKDNQQVLRRKSHLCGDFRMNVSEFALLF